MNKENGSSAGIPIWVKLSGTVLWIAGGAGIFVFAWLWGVTHNPYYPGTIAWAEREMNARFDAVLTAMVYLFITLAAHALFQRRSR